MLMLAEQISLLWEMPPWQQRPRVIIHSQPRQVTDAAFGKRVENADLGGFALSSCPESSQGKQESVMTKLEEIVKRQKQGAKFVLSFQMLGMDVETFDTVAQTWIEHGGPGFEAAGVPFRKVIDGEFLIARLTVVKTAEE
jgi:hypothetical protein